MKKFLIILLCLFMSSYAHEDVNLNLLLDISYLNRSLTDKEYFKTEVPNYIHSILEDNDHNHAVRKNGFNLNYGEIAFLFPLTERVELFGTFHLAEYTFEIEEFYGLYEDKNIFLKAGKFRSETGILNKQHDHDWYFYELPYVYLSFFSVHGLNEKGIQIKFQREFLNTGFEILNGEGENSFGYSNASLYTLFFKPNYKNLSIGTSYIQGKDVIGKTVKIYILESLLNFNKFLLQGEYIQRQKNETLYGYYVFGIFKVLKNLDTGYRYEYLKGNLFRHSFVFNYYYSQNIRFRVQYSIDKSRFIEIDRKNVKEFILELTFSKSFNF